MLQSQKRITKSKQKRPRLPWGMGTLKKHGNCWWATYRDAKGKVHFDNLNTEDPAEARRLLAQRSLPKARAAVALLEQIANEEPDQGNREAKRQVRPGAKRKVRQRPAGAGGKSPRARSTRSPRKGGQAK